MWLVPHVITTVGLPFEPWAARIAPAASPEQRLAELGVELLEPLPVVGGYRLTKRHGDTVYVAGHVSATPDRTGLITGKVGGSLSLDRRGKPPERAPSTCSPRCARSSAP